MNIQRTMLTASTTRNSGPRLYWRSTRAKKPRLMGNQPHARPRYRSSTFVLQLGPSAGGAVGRSLACGRFACDAVRPARRLRLTIATAASRHASSYGTVSSSRA